MQTFYKGIYINNVLDKGQVLQSLHLMLYTQYLISTNQNIGLRGTQYLKQPIRSLD